MSRVSVKREDPLYTYAIKYIENAWGVVGRFPGCQPISIEYKHFDILRNNDYVVCEKTDGVRYMMVCFMYQNKKVSLFVNRAMELFVCPLNFRKPVYEGTILEGELYEDTFMVYDCLTDSGAPVGHKDFVQRLAHCEGITKKLMALKTDAVKLRVKTFHLLCDYDKFLNEYLPTVSQEIDGLIFTPVHESVKIGTHETMFKWKPREKNTIDFKLKYQYDQWRMFVQEKGELIFETIIPPNKEFDYSLLKDGAIVECAYITDEIPMWWKPLKIREDKTHPNNRRTFYRTLVNIKEDIKITDFLKCM